MDIPDDLIRPDEAVHEWKRWHPRVSDTTLRRWASNGRWGLEAHAIGGTGPGTGWRFSMSNLLAAALKAMGGETRRLVLAATAKDGLQVEVAPADAASDFPLTLFLSRDGRSVRYRRRELAEEAPDG